MVLVKNWNFFHSLCLGKTGQEMLFVDTLERKIDTFPKRLTHGFSPKMAMFANLFFLGNIGQKNVFYDILEREKAFLGYQKRSSKRPFFPNSLTHGFAEKMAIFPTFSFKKYGPGKTPF